MLGELTALPQIPLRGEAHRRDGKARDGAVREYITEINFNRYMTPD